jgi:hypothetical protein
MRFEGDVTQVARMLLGLETATNPVAIAGFLGSTVDPYLRGRGRRRFSEEGDDVTGKWVPLSPATQAIRADLGYGADHPINVRTGELERYINDSPNQLSAHPWGASLTLPGNPPTGDLADKVMTAQQGSTSSTSGRPIPPRPVLGMNQKDTMAVLLLLYGYIKNAMGGRL